MLIDIRHTSFADSFQCINLAEYVKRRAEHFQQDLLYVFSMETGMERLREFIVRRRGELRLSQVELAKLAGIKSATIAAIEAGRVSRNPRLDTLDGLAKGLRVDVEMLISLMRGDQPKPKGDSEDITAEEREALQILRELQPSEMVLALRMLKGLRESK